MVGVAKTARSRPASTCSGRDHGRAGARGRGRVPDREPPPARLRPRRGRVRRRRPRHRLERSHHHVEGRARVRPHHRHGHEGPAGHRAAKSRASSAPPSPLIARSGRRGAVAPLSLRRRRVRLRRGGLLASSLELPVERLPAADDRGAEPAAPAGAIIARFAMAIGLALGLTSTRLGLNLRHFRSFERGMAWSRSAFRSLAGPAAVIILVSFSSPRGRSSREVEEKAVLEEALRPCRRRSSARRPARPSARSRSSRRRPPSTTRIRCPRGRVRRPREALGAHPGRSRTTSRSLDFRRTTWSCTASSAASATRRRSARTSRRSAASRSRRSPVPTRWSARTTAKVRARVRPEVSGRPEGHRQEAATGTTASSATPATPATGGK